jgi:hypothetical protein
MVDVAQTWFDSLPNYTRRLMNESLDEWVDELLSRFQANASSAIMEADAMKYTFADESQLDVREYITKKIQLYAEAGED